MITSGGPVLNADDPREPSPSPTSFLGAWARRLVRDPRDVELVRVIVVLTLVTIPFAVALFAAPSIPWWLGLIYTVWVLTQWTDRYVLTLHVVSHRPLFRREFGVLNHYVPVFLAPFFGQTPYSYFVHHVGMHHAEENLPDDLSSTMPFQRDRFVDFVRYTARFFFLGPVDLSRYLIKTGRRKLLWRFVAGELGFWVLMVPLLWWKPLPTFFVFILPLLLLRVFMMQGNWAQHAFVDGDDPDNPYRNSVCLINSRHNRRCWNDGYHIVHHRKPTMHWTEHPEEFLRNLDEYGRYDAMVFRDVRNFQVIWRWLMRDRYDLLAAHFVDLSGRARSRQEIEALIRSRVARCT